MTYVDALLSRASEVYAIEYFGIVIAVALLECVVPRRAADDTLRTRWAGNISIAIVDMVVIRWLFPILGIGWAVFCRERGWGLFNRFPGPGWAEFGLTLVGIDLATYAQHYLFHQIPLLWQLHRVHHTDQQYDFTTGLRFHPLEGVLSSAVLLGTVFALGAPPAAVFVSQLLAVAVSFAEHANIRIPSSLDRVVRILLVTPDMHRIHHSQNVREGQSNFANTLSCWDRLFGTYLDRPAAGHEHIVFGLTEFSERKYLTLPWMLVQPFLRVRGRANQTGLATSDVGPARPLKSG
jgi:sterol desaturase/sphingolipid hydroxylase (fatty acid hydroxylase superfamily)